MVIIARMAVYYNIYMNQINAYIRYTTCKYKSIKIQIKYDLNNLNVLMALLCQVLASNLFNKGYSYLVHSLLLHEYILEFYFKGKIMFYHYGFTTLLDDLIVIFGTQ